MSADFLPVLLGSDINVYGMARSFHQAYATKCIAVGKGILPACMNSKIVTVEFVEPNIEDDDVFVATLLKVAEKYKEQFRKRLLVPCGDNYIKLLVRNQDKLREHFLFECIDEDLLNQLSIKANFYKVCAKYGFAFPKTATCTVNNYKKGRPPFDFPIIIKPSNSVAYWNCSFEHKKKVFIANDQDECDEILEAIYSSDYKDPLILQEFIPGDDSYMRVMNCYCGKDKKVKLIALGNVVLEEHSPEGIGSYAAIISGYDKKLSDRVSKFLESIGYVGFANFDMKFDVRDRKYKLFEINLRQGRSSFYATAAGYNLAKWLADDIVYDKPMKKTIATNKVLYSIIPKKLLLKYTKNAFIKDEIKLLYLKDKVYNSYYYSGDKSFKRYIAFIKNQLNYHKKYKKYFGNKSLRD